MFMIPLPMRTPGYTLPLLMAVGVLLTAGANAEKTVAEAKNNKTEKEEPPKLREAEDKALRGFVEKLTQAKQRLYLEDMEKLAATIAEEISLDETATTRLKDGIEAAVTAAMDGWQDKAYAWLAPFAGRSPNAMREMARWPVEQIARSPGVKEVTGPDEQPVWRDFLKSLLTPEQWTRWEEKLARDARELEQRVAEYVKLAAENQRPLLETEISLAQADILNTLALPEERAQKVTALADEAVTAALAGWEEAALKALDEMERERREAVLSHGGGMGVVEGEFHPQEQACWTEGLAKLLTTAERERIEQTQAARQARRVEASRLALLQILDERTALTAAQRELLPPLLDEAAEKLATQMRRYYNLDPNTVGMLLRDCDLKPLRAALEDSQQRGLDALLSPKTHSHPDAAALEKAQELPPPVTEEDLERLLSEDLTRRYDEAAQARLEEMRTHLDDLRRHARLTPEQDTVLELAARGAVQDSLGNFRQQMSAWLRQSIAGTPAQAVRQRLLTLGASGFGNDVAAKDTEFWTATLERTLDVFQKQEWQEVLSLRERELRRTQVLLVVSELEHQLALTEEQAAFFERRLGEIIERYAEDLDEYRGARRWHLHAYSMLTPVAGIPEVQLKERLTPAQFELWREKSENQVRHYWEGVKRNHENRLRAKKGGGS